MGYNLWGQPGEGDNFPYKLQPGQVKARPETDDEDLDIGDLINPGYGADGQPGVALPYAGQGGQLNLPKESEELDTEKGYAVGQALYNMFPENILEEYSKAWAKYGDDGIAMGVVRKTPAWKNEFQHLERDDGSLIMTELESLATKATYRESLAEIGIIDTEEFEGKFNELIKGEVSASEFQQRIDLVYEAVKNNIPEVEELFRTQYGIETDAPTIFAALINPDLEDKLLKGDLQTISVAAEAKRAGFSGAFSKFERLRKSGLSQADARQLYESAGTYQTMGVQTGSGFDIETAEAAATGDIDATKQLGLLASEQASMSSGKVGAARKDRKYTGLVQD
tara:strand:+ start:11591 stop:12604 length:1014 start_codon:yes stop_codon:yes gene_type:complete